MEYGLIDPVLHTQGNSSHSSLELGYQEAPLVLAASVLVVAPSVLRRQLLVQKLVVKMAMVARPASAAQDAECRFEWHFALASCALELEYPICFARLEGQMIESP